MKKDIKETHFDLLRKLDEALRINYEKEKMKLRIVTLENTLRI